MLVAKENVKAMQRLAEILMGVVGAQRGGGDGGVTGEVKSEF